MDADNADIRPIYDEEPMAELQLTAECNIVAIGQHHTEQLEIINEGQCGQILNETSNIAKIKKEIDACEIINIELEHNVAKLLTENKHLHKENKTLNKHYKDLLEERQLNAFKYERTKISKPRFASQVDVKNDLSNPVTQHYLPKGREYAFAKPHHVIASSASRNSSKNMPRFISNDMVHNHYLKEAKKKTQEKDRNLKSSVMHSTRL
nr:hypothetical protein [Tanacetum cinerariifolium]